MMYILEESYRDCEQELVELGRKHYKEIEILPLEYNPDLELFRLMDNSDMLFVITIRDSEGVLKGYSLNTISKHLIYKGVLHSECCLLFVSEDTRGGYALKLMKHTEEKAKQLGASFHTWDVPALNDYSVILERQGCTKIESRYSKMIGG